jgi:hypothetical protein
MADAMLGHELTQHLLSVFGTTFLRCQQGISDRAKPAARTVWNYGPVSPV